VKPGKFAPLLMVMFHICEVSVSNPDAWRLNNSYTHSYWEMSLLNSIIYL
jgi:hypothetical protein